MRASSSSNRPLFLVRRHISSILRNCTLLFSHDVSLCSLSTSRALSRCLPIQSLHFTRFLMASLTFSSFTNAISLISQFILFTHHLFSFSMSLGLSFPILPSSLQFPAQISSLLSLSFLHTLFVFPLTPVLLCSSVFSREQVLTRHSLPLSAVLSHLTWLSLYSFGSEPRVRGGWKELQFSTYFPFSFSLF